jgi:adenylate cyclase, class 2
VPGPLRLNVEVKARDPSPRTSLAICNDIGASDRGTMWQRDTYFEAAHGRLKLRQEDPGSAHLIHYERADEPHPRTSSYRIAPVQDPNSLRSVLEACLRSRVVVTKRRRLFLWENVRIHLDQVDQLGAFIELEAFVAPGEDPSGEHALIRDLSARFAITEDQLYLAAMRIRYCRHRDGKRAAF